MIEWFKDKILLSLLIFFNIFMLVSTIFVVVFFTIIMPFFGDNYFEWALSSNIPLFKNITQDKSIFNLYNAISVLALYIATNTIPAFVSIKRSFKKTIQNEERSKLIKDVQQLTVKNQELVQSITEYKVIENYENIKKSVNTVEKGFHDFKDHISDRINSLVVSYADNKQYRAILINYLEEIKKNLDEDNSTIRIVSNYMFCRGNKIYDPIEYPDGVPGIDGESNHSRVEVIDKVTEIIISHNMKLNFMISTRNEIESCGIDDLHDSIFKEIEFRLKKIVAASNGTRNIWMNINFCDNTYNDLLAIEDYFFIHFNSTDNQIERSGFMVEDVRATKIIKERFDRVWEGSVKKKNHPLYNLQNKIKEKIEENKEFAGYYEFINLNM